MEDIVRSDCIAAFVSGILRQRHGSCVGVPTGACLSPFGVHKDSSRARLSLTRSARLMLGMRGMGHPT